MKKNMHTHAKKGSSQTIWIIVAIIIALATALAIIVVTNQMINKGKDSAEGPMGTAADSLQVQTCQRACDNCKVLYGAGCTTKWQESVGGKCVTSSPPILSECS